MANDFLQYAAKGNEILNILAGELKIPSDKALRILTAVLHATRDHLNVEESTHVLSQLPMALKGLYADQWDLHKPLPRIHHVHEFINQIRSYDAALAAYDLGNDEKAKVAVKAVYRILSGYISAGEFRDLTAGMPSAIRTFIMEAVEPQKV